MASPKDYAVVVGKLMRNYTTIDSDAQKTIPVRAYNSGKSL